MNATDIVGWARDGDLYCPGCHGPETPDCEGCCAPIFADEECGPLGITCCQPVGRGGKRDQCGTVISPPWEGTEKDHTDWYGTTRYMSVETDGASV